MRHFTEAANVLELGNLTRAQVVGFSAGFSNLKKSESALGLFSDSFVDTAEKLAREIVKAAKASKNTTKIIQWWIEATAITTVGLLELVREKKGAKNEESVLDAPFRDELVLSLLFYSKAPELIFEQMAEAIGIEGSSESVFTGLFKVISLVFALIAYSKEEETVRKELGEILTAKLQEALKSLQTRIEDREVEAYLDSAAIALEKGDIDYLATLVLDLLKLAGYSKKLLYEDITAMKDLFKRLKTAYFATKSNNMNMMYMIG